MSSLTKNEQKLDKLQHDLEVLQEKMNHIKAQRDIAIAEVVAERDSQALDIRIIDCDGKAEEGKMYSSWEDVSMLPTFERHVMSFGGEIAFDFQ